MQMKEIRFLSHIIYKNQLKWITLENVKLLQQSIEENLSDIDLENEDLRNPKAQTNNKSKRQTGLL